MTACSSQFDYCREQRFTCSRCGACCNTMEAAVTETEKVRLEQFRFNPAIDLNHAFLPHAAKLWKIAKTAAGRCVFLNDDGWCRIHLEGGVELKPLACRLYPFVLYRWQDGQVSVDGRYYCPSVGPAAGGELLTHYESQFRELNERLRLTGSALTVAYSRDNPASLEAVRQVHRAFRQILEHGGMPLGLRLYSAARILEFHRRRDMREAIVHADAHFVDDAMAFLEKAGDRLRTEWAGGTFPHLDSRLKYRLAVSGFFRDDSPRAGWGAGWRRVRSLYRWMTGAGSLRELNPTCPDTAGIDLFSTRRVNRRTAEADRELEVWLAAKLDSMHYCSRACLNFSWEDGMRHLLLAVPAAAASAGMMAAAAGEKVISGPGQRRTLSYVDTTFRLSPFFRTRYYRTIAVKLCRPDVYAGLLQTFFNRNLSEGDGL